MAFDNDGPDGYAELLTRTLPRVIKSEKENEACIDELERLDTLGRPMTAAEKLYGELMTVLVQRFEQSTIRWNTRARSMP